jgi:hypothetical protein
MGMFMILPMPARDIVLKVIMFILWDLFNINRKRGRS